MRQQHRNGLLTGAKKNWMGAALMCLAWLLPQTATAQSTQFTFGETFGATTAPTLGFSVRPTSDSGYIVATSSVATGSLETPVVIKLDSTGHITWQNSYSIGGSTHISVIKQTSDSGYVMAGANTTGVVVSAVVIKLNSSGTVTWQKTYSATFGAAASWIEPTTDGGFIFAGTFNGTWAWAVKLDGSGNIAWQNTYTVASGSTIFTSIQPTNDGGYAAAGSLGVGSAPTSPWVVKLDTNGNVTWQQVYGDTYPGEASSIEQTTDGGYIVGGSETVRQGNTVKFRAVAMKTDSSGNVTWRNYYSQAGTVMLPPGFTGMIRQGTDGNFGLLIPRSIAIGAIQAVVAKLDQTTGFVTMQSDFGVAPGAIASWIEPTPDGGYAVAGSSFLIVPPYSNSLMLKLDSSLHAGVCGKYTGQFNVSAVADPATVSSPTVATAEASGLAGVPSITTTVSTFNPTTVCK